MKEKLFRAGLKYLLQKTGRGGQKNLAKNAGVKPSYVSNIIRGVKPASSQVRKSFADFFGMTEEDITFLGKGILEGYPAELWLKSLRIRNDPEFNFLSTANNWYTVDTIKDEKDLNLFFAVALYYFYLKKGESIIRKIIKCCKLEETLLKDALSGNIDHFSGKINKEEIAGLFIFSLDDFVELGQQIITGMSGDEYLLNYCEDFFIRPDCFFNDEYVFWETIKQKIQDDHNLELIFRWIGQQKNPSDYWVFLKILLSREEPEFKKWLEQQSK